jgi:integrase
MGVFKKQGVYWIDYYVQGQRKRERIGPDKRLADTVLRKRKVEIAEGMFLDKRKVPRCSFNELANLYLEWAKANHRGYASTRSHVEHLKGEFGALQLGEVTPLIIDSYVAQRAAMRKPATVNREIEILRPIFRKAQEWGRAIDKPIKHQQPLRANNRGLRDLSLEEMEHLLSVADERLRPIFITVLHTGLRRGELFHLTW